VPPTLSSKPFQLLSCFLSDLLPAQKLSLKDAELGGLKSFSFEPGLTNNLALVPCIVPNSSLNIDKCLFNT